MIVFHTSGKVIGCPHIKSIAEKVVPLCPWETDRPPASRHDLASVDNRVVLLSINHPQSHVMQVIEEHVRGVCLIRRFHFTDIRSDQVLRKVADLPGWTVSRNLLVYMNLSSVEDGVLYQVLPAALLVFS